MVGTCKREVSRVSFAVAGKLISQGLGRGSSGSTKENQGNRFTRKLRWALFVRSGILQTACWLKLPTRESQCSMLEGSQQWQRVIEITAEPILDGMMMKKGFLAPKKEVFFSAEISPQRCSKTRVNLPLKVPSIVLSREKGNANSNDFPFWPTSITCLYKYYNR